MYNIVPSSGPISAEVALIGEAPAFEECRVGKPFMGSAGNYLSMLLRLAKLDRSLFRIKNLSQERAPNDKMANMPKDKLEYWTLDLIDRINAMPNVKILVPMGNFPLEAITGRKGISNYRGSILKPLPSIHKDCIVLPTLHPSVMHYHYEDWVYIEADFEKLRKLIDNNYIFTPPKFNFDIRPSIDTVILRLEQLLLEQELNRDKYYTLDVETPHGFLSCIGIGWSKYDAMCIPFMYGNGQNYWTEDEENLLWRKLAEILPKLNINNQNYLFDWEILARHGIWLKMPQWDPMLMHHCLYSSMRHSLHILTSIYTDIPFYKKDEREEKEVKGSALMSGREEEHWKYNSLDCCAAWWCIDELIKELIEENMMATYEDLYVPLYPVLLKMNMTGIGINMDNLKDHRELLTDNLTKLSSYLESKAGHPINPNSPKDVKNFLVGELGMKPYRTRSGSITMDEEALEKLAYKYNSDIPNKIAESRKVSRELSLFSDDNVSENRMHCRFSAGRAATGRLASLKSVSGKGMNLQNVKDSPAKKVFEADKGHIFIGPDLKQADARTVAWYSKDPNMIRVAESGELHMKNAEMVYGERITKDDERYGVAKSLMHAGNYDVGERVFAQTIGKPVAEARKYLSLFHYRYPGIRNVFHVYVQREIMKSRTLYNPFGRRAVFFGRKDRETFKKGYAFIGQSTTGDINKKALVGISKIYYVPLEIHDGLILHVPVRDEKEAIEIIYDVYGKIRFKIYGIEHNIPVDIKIGKNWLEMETI